jgi:hypothetical protein
MEYDYEIELEGYEPYKGLDYPTGNNLPAVKKFVTRVAEALNIHYTDKPIVLWCRGSSGALLAGALSLLVPCKQIVHIKKDGESSHNMNVEPIPGNYYHMIIDDFVSSGQTVRIIYEKYKKHYNKNPDALIIEGAIPWIKDVSVETIIYNPRLLGI